MWDEYKLYRAAQQAANLPYVSYHKYLATYFANYPPEGSVELPNAQIVAWFARHPKYRETFQALKNAHAARKTQTAIEVKRVSTGCPEPCRKYSPRGGGKP